MTLYCSIVVCFTLAHSFNVDVDNIVSFRGDNGTGFGYSALLLNNNDGRWYVIVSYYIFLLIILLRNLSNTN